MTTATARKVYPDSRTLPDGHRFTYHVGNGNTIEYVVRGGTCYHAETSPELITLLERLRHDGRRVHLELGDVETGRSWGDVETGRIGRSGGTVRVPLSVYNARSLGGPALLDHCIIEVRETRGGRVLWTCKK